MSERCVDASVGIAWIDASEPFHSQAQQLLKDSLFNGISLIAPPLFAYETESVLQNRIVRQAIAQADADLALQALDQVGIQILDPPGLVPLARSIARQFQQKRIYDAVYAALAQLRGCDFWTADKAFHDDVKSVLTFVKYLANYP